MDNERQGQASPTPGARLFVQLGKVGRWPLFGVRELASVKEAWEGRGMQLQVPTRGQQGAVKGRSCISRGGERGCHLCPVEVVHSQVGGNHPRPLAPKRCVQPVCFGNNPRTRLSFEAMLKWKILHNKKRPGKLCTHPSPWPGPGLLPNKSGSAFLLPGCRWPGLSSCFPEVLLLGITQSSLTRWLAVLPLKEMTSRTTSLQTSM